MLELNEIIELSKDDKHISEITTEKLVQARAILLTTSNNNKELLNVLVPITKMTKYCFDLILEH